MDSFMPTPPGHRLMFHYTMPGPQHGFLRILPEGTGFILESAVRHFATMMLCQTLRL
jgi:hypothetical protein